MSEILDTSKLGLRNKTKREMKTVIDPLSKMNSGIKMVTTKYVEQSPMLTPGEAAHIPGEHWEEIPKGHCQGVYGKYRCIVNGQRFFCDSIAKDEPLPTKLPTKSKKGKAGQPSAKEVMKGK